MICEENECNRYKLLTEECLDIHKCVYHGDEQFEDGDRSIEHSCRKENEKLKCRTLIETNISGEPKYKDKKGTEYNIPHKGRKKTEFMNNNKELPNKHREGTLKGRTQQEP